MTSVNKQIQLKNLLESSRKSIVKRKRICLHPGCLEYAIGSHVLQQRFILANIVDRHNTFYSIKSIGLHEMSENKHFKISKVSVGSGYKFLGFCKTHDNDLFREIETHPLDLFNRRVQALFSYRTLCLELRKQQQYLETCEGILKSWKIVAPEKKHYVNFIPSQLAIKDLEFFKKELEDELLNGTENYDYYSVELPEQKVCFSASLTVSDPTNHLTSEYDEYGRTRTAPIVSTIINYFPYNSKSYFIAAIHKHFPCNWTKNTVLGLQDKHGVDKIISDILTFRIEFWGINPELYESISEEKREIFLRESEIHAENYDLKIESNFNLFA